MNIRTKNSWLVQAIWIILAGISLFLLSGCGVDAPQAESPPEPAQEDADVSAESETEVIEDTQTESEAESAVPADDTATYTVTFNAVWSVDTHPDYYVSSAHFSPLITYAHNGTADAQVFTVGSTSSPGMEQMAETGATAFLEDEIANVVSAANALGYVKGQRIDSPGVDQAELQFSQEFSQMTFVSMIAPSPDWFVTAEANLFVDGNWVDEVVLEFISYDAGTDSGPELTSPDTDTDPEEGIDPFPEYLQGLGTVTLTRILPNS